MNVLLVDIDNRFFIVPSSKEQANSERDQKVVQELKPDHADAGKKLDLQSAGVSAYYADGWDQISVDPGLKLSIIAIL
jgi:phage terminase large subunit-like protein